MTDKSFEISVDAIHNESPGSLLAEVQRQLIEGLVDRDEKEMDQLINGRWPEEEQPRISVYEEPIAPRSPHDNVGLFQQQAPTWGTSVTPPDNMSGDRERLKCMFADKLNTHAPEPKPETQVVPRKNGKRTVAAQSAGNAGLSKKVVSSTQASAHTHSIGGAMQQGKLQAGALNIAGRDVKECLDCGALVIDDQKHRNEHAQQRVTEADLVRQLADAREEIRELKEARTRKVPRPKKKTPADELRELQAEARAQGALTPEARRGALQQLADGTNPRMFKVEIEGSYGPTDILQPRSFVDMKMHVGES